MGLRLVPVLVFSLSFSLGKLYSQPEGVITLINPSFEDMPRHSKPPRGWFDCGVPGETPPDVQPSGTFSVTKPAVNGDTYLGMVVRDNDTWEMVSQRMSAPMKKGQCYAFSIYLCRSELYVSVSRMSDETANYTTPAKLRIYGGFDHCDKQYLLGETNLVINTRWLEYQFKFEPLDNYTHISFEAFYKTPTLFPYNGNILMDNASDITPVNCNEELSERLPQKPTETSKPTTSATPPTKRPDSISKVAQSSLDKKTEPNTAPSKSGEGSSSDKNSVVESADFSKLSRDDIRKGQTLRMDNILFEIDKSVVTKESYEPLNNLARFLLANPDIVIEVGGHTNGLCSDGFCDQLSTARARVVSEYLAQRGVSRSRLEYKGYGRKVPVASNDTVEGRRKNQRVEIKILNMNAG